MNRVGFPATGTIQDKEARRSIDALNKAFSDLAETIVKAKVSESVDVALEEGEGIEIEATGKNRFRITCTVTATESLPRTARSETSIPDGTNDGDILFWKDNKWTVASMAGLAGTDVIEWDGSAKVWKKLTPTETEMVADYRWASIDKKFSRRYRKQKVLSAGTGYSRTEWDDAVSHSSLH
jgi:hypothetical protein